MARSLAKLHAWTKAGFCARAILALEFGLIPPSTPLQPALDLGLHGLVIGQRVASQQRTHLLRVSRVPQPEQSLGMELARPLVTDAKHSANAGIEGATLSRQAVASHDDKAQPLGESSHKLPQGTDQFLAFSHPVWKVRLRC